MMVEVGMWYSFHISRPKRTQGKSLRAIRGGGRVPDIGGLIWRVMEAFRRGDSLVLVKWIFRNLGGVLLSDSAARDSVELSLILMHFDGLLLMFPGIFRSISI